MLRIQLLFVVSLKVHERFADYLSIKKKNLYLCLVLSGFYGRPWTLDQRKDLFIKLQEWGMNSYLYAPKDDYKHVILSLRSRKGNTD